jgi:c-di-GMP-binding flagellar brake protein YcgR
MTTHAKTLPEPESADNEEFHVYSRREIVAILKDIADRRAVVTLYFREGESFIVTNLLKVNPEFEEVIFDPPQDQAALRAIGESKRLVFVTFVEQVKTQFAARQAEATRFEDHPAMRIRLPDSVMRLQRRNFFRVPAPRSVPLICEVPLADGSKTRFEVGDLSVGGLAMLAGPASSEFEAGAVFHNCRIDLPDHGVITTSIELRNRSESTRAGRDDSQVRFGCRFLNLGGTVETLIQRYINHLERARRALT